MENEFKLTSEVREDCLIIHTTGYLNNEGGEKLGEEFNNHFKNGITKIIINLEKSKVVNSIGISFLIEIIEKLNTVQGKMVFTNLDPAIEKTLTIMGIFNYAGKVATVAHALKTIA
jgi:anti-anti-sigma factor